MSDDEYTLHTLLLGDLMLYLEALNDLLSYSIFNITSNAQRAQSGGC